MSTNPVSSHAEASPARADLSRRAILRGAPSVAALAVAAAVPAGAMAAGDADAELRRLWGEFLRLSRIEAETGAPSHAAHKAFMAEIPRLEDQPPEVSYWDWQAMQDPLREKHNLAELYDAWIRTSDDVYAVVEVIRVTPATTVFGIGIKLVALSWLDRDNEDKHQDAFDEVLADIGGLTGIDFVAQAEAAGDANV